MLSTQKTFDRKVYNRIYYSQNRERECLRSREYRETHKEQVCKNLKKYRFLHKEDIARTHRAWLLSNGDRVLQYQKNRLLKLKGCPEIYERLRVQARKRYYKIKSTLAHKRRQKVSQQNRRVRELNVGYLSIKIIQRVYEENIKQHKTLTCVLCLKPILFGEDSLEHLTPLARGGTNEYKNLAIAHRKCNNSKNKKTYAEWLRWKC